MRTFSNLLVYGPASATGPSVSYARRLSAAGNASVTLVDIAEQIPEEIQHRLPAGWDVLQLIRDQKKARLDRTANRLTRAGARAQIVVVERASADALLHEMTEGGHDLLIVDVPHEPATRDAHEIIARLVHDCPSRLLLARAPVRRRPRILVTVDVSPWRSPGVDDLTSELIETAVDVAQRINGEVQVLHAWESIAERSMRWAGVSEGTLNDYQDAARSDARDELQPLLEPFREHIAESRVHLEEGDPRKVIPGFAAHNDIDLVVIGTVARSGLAGRIIGNTAEAVLDDLPCSMLVVRRDRIPEQEDEAETAYDTRHAP